jgi:ATP-dependent DNA helicase RecQ
MDPITIAVQNLFGLSYLLPYQRLVVANILEAAQVAHIPIHWPQGPIDEDELPDTEEDDRGSTGHQIVVLPTGAGKSLCFQLPALLLSGATLVIYPIRSLMADQERRLQERGFMPVMLHGAQTTQERAAIWEKIHSGAGRFIIANPEVLLSNSVRERLAGLHIVHVVVDEAHCVSEWGESFRPAYREIGAIIKATGAPLVTAFTATASAPVLEKIDQYLFATGGAHRIIGNPDRSNIRYAAQGCVLRDLAVRDILQRSARPAIVFCSSRPGTEHLARKLRNELDDTEVYFYHAGLDRAEKTELERWFFASRTGTLVATCAYGMGVDKADIRTVIHRDCPPSVEAYLQESGRAGRDGLPSQAMLLWGNADYERLERLRSEAHRFKFMQLLKYARDTSACRRAALLSLLDYEGSGDSPETGCCDVCDGTASDTVREEHSLRAFFKKNRLRYTSDEASIVLSRCESLHCSPAEAKAVLEQLIADAILKPSRFPLWKGKLLTYDTHDDKAIRIYPRRDMNGHE